MTVPKPGRPKKDAKPKGKIEKVTIVLDDSVKIAIEKLVDAANRNNVGFKVKKSAVLRKVILEAAERVGS